MVTLVGIDIGATKAELRIRTSETAAEPGTVRRYETGQWQNLSWAEKARKIAGWIADAAIEDDIAVGIGAHGCDSLESCDALRTAIRRLIDHPVRVVSDAELLAYAAGVPTAISVIAGTGCIAIARDAAGDVLRGGGHGWLIGDDGGATGIVREAARGAIRARDLGSPDLLLETALTEALGQSRFADVSLHLMLRRAAEWAGSAPAVFAAAENGSPVARHVLDRAVEYVHDIVRSVIRQGATGRHVALGGGVFASQAGYTSRVLERLGKDPSLTVEYVTERPSTGALQLAGSFASLA